MVEYLTRQPPQPKRELHFQRLVLQSVKHADTITELKVVTGLRSKWDALKKREVIGRR